MQWHLRCRSKCALDFVLRHPLVNYPAFEEKMKRLCHALAAENIGRITMLSPLPAIDPVVGRNRRNALQCYRRLAAEYGFVYCEMTDLQPDPDDHVFERGAFYADPVHLGIAGHQAVAKRLQESVGELFPEYSRAQYEYVSAR
jgi:lysophospholipase L1-like esterase